MPSCTSEIEAVDLFCGASGLSYGLKRAGIQVVRGIDADGKCAYPFEANTGAPFVQADVRELKVRDVKRWFSGEGPRLLAGCAPCQPFSIMNAHRARHGAAGETLLDAFADIALGLRPEFLTLENVPAVARTEAFRRCVSRFEAAGYLVTYGEIDAYDYGAPQHRRRLVCIASRIGSERPTLMKTPGPRPKTVHDAIGSLPPLAAGERDDRDPLHSAGTLSPVNLARIQASRPGGTWCDWPESLRLRCHGTEAGRQFLEAYGRMSWQQAAPTITTKFFNYGSGRFAHPEQDRTITPREAALLQGFPKTFKFHPASERLARTDLGRLIGNAIPVPLGKAIGRSFGRALERVRQ